MNGFSQNLAHIVNQSSSEDNLQLVPGHKNAFGQINSFNGFYICLVIILQYLPQTGGAVGHTNDVVPSPDQAHDICSYFFVAFSFIRIHVLIPPIMIPFCNAVHAYLTARYGQLLFHLSL